MGVTVEHRMWWAIHVHLCTANHLPNHTPQSSNTPNLWRYRCHTLSFLASRTAYIINDCVVKCNMTRKWLKAHDTPPPFLSTFNSHFDPITYITLLPLKQWLEWPSRAKQKRCEILTKFSNHSCGTMWESTVYKKFLKRLQQQMSLSCKMQSMQALHMSQDKLWRLPLQLMQFHWLPMLPIVVIAVLV